MPLLMSAARARRSLALALALPLLAACGRPSGEGGEGGEGEARPEAPPPPPASAVAPVAAAPTSSEAAAPTSSEAAPTSSAAAAPPKAPAGPAPLSDAEKATAAAYLKSLGRGRKATRAKDFPAAIAAFDEALKIRPDDGVALGERGYARLQAKDLDAARKDLQSARDRAGSPEIVAQVIYNLALLEKERGNAEAGQALEAQAKTLRAQVKQGKPAAPASAAAPAAACPVSVFRPETQGETLDSWQELWERLATDFEERFSKPFSGAAHIGLQATEQDIRRVLGTGKGQGPWLVTMAEEEGLGTVWHIVGQQPEGKLVLFFAVEANKTLARCRAGAQEARFEAAPVPRLTVVSVTDEYGLTCKKNGKLERCDGTEGEPPVHSFCDRGTYTISTLFFDMAAGRVLLQTDESGPDRGQVIEARVSVLAQPDGVLLAGAGCSGKHSFRP